MDSRGSGGFVTHGGNNIGNSNTEPEPSEQIIVDNVGNISLLIDFLSTSQAAALLCFS
jgi:hypothetical protein